MLTYKKGNLLEAKVDAVVNTVNTVGVMGKGIALQFKKAFPENFKKYKEECDAGNMQPGRVLVIQVGGITQPRWIINFPTKKHWRNKSKIDFIRDGLKSLADEIRRLKISSIAVPPLGCGYGGLDWKDVQPLIEATFADLPDVEAWVYPPHGAPAADRMPNRTARPKMTDGRAALLSLMSRYLVPGFLYRLSLLEIQKLAYFLQEAGEPLRLNYKAHHYGPYADNLRHVLNRLEGHYTLGYGDGRNSPETPIELMMGAADEAVRWLSDKSATQARLERVSTLIEGFETSYGMELLATVHWVALHETANSNDLDSVILGVQRWSKRKAAFESAHITAALNRLEQQGWLPLDVQSESVSASAEARR